MSDLSDTMRALAEAVRKHPGPKSALLGFDLWLEVMASPHVSSREVLQGGAFATGQEDPKVLKVPVPVLGKRVVIAFDACLGPQEFIIRP
jgi:hypothetical protein